MKKKFTIFYVLLLLILPYWIHSQFKVKKLEQKKLFVKPSISILYPNGGEKWEKGKSYTIHWKSIGISGNVKINLKWGTSSGGWFNVTNSTPNTGTYLYNIPRTGIGQAGNQFKIYVMTPDESVKDKSDGFFSIIRKGIIHLHPPIFRFSFPKKGDVLQRGKQYTLSWRQIRETSDNVNSIKIALFNLRTRQQFWITQGTQNKGFYGFTMPVNAPNGDYIFRIMPLNESFTNQSPEFKIGSFDLICEIRNFARVFTYKDYVLAREEKYYVEFEIWIMNKGTGIFSMVPVVWRVIDKITNRVIIQKEAGFSNVYPNRYYSAKIKENFYVSRSVFPVGKVRDRKFFDTSRAIIEVEVDPKNILHESKEFRKNNMVRREVEYDMHIKGHK